MGTVTNLLTFEEFEPLPGSPGPMEKKIRGCRTHGGREVRVAYADTKTVWVSCEGGARPGETRLETDSLPALSRDLPALLESA